MKDAFGAHVRAMLDVGVPIAAAACARRTDPEN
jgi:hypothetical protein